MTNVRKILIVDDDADVRESLVEHFALHDGIEVVAVETGIKGVQVARAGHVDLVIETELKPHDIIPLIPIIVGAGGVVTTWEGAPATAGGRVIAAGDRRTHAAAQALLTGS